MIVIITGNLEDYVSYLEIIDRVMIIRFLTQLIYTRSRILTSRQSMQKALSNSCKGSVPLFLTKIRSFITKWLMRLNHLVTKDLK